MKFEKEEGDLKTHIMVRNIVCDQDSSVTSSAVLHQEIIINLKCQGHNWLVAFPLKWVNNLDCLCISSCQSSVASTNDISRNIN